MPDAYKHHTMRRFYSAAFTFFLFFTLQLSAQTGKYDLNFALSHVDCDNLQLYVDIQIKAHEGESAFRLSDQNYRFQFNDALVYGSAFIEQELEVSGHIESSTGNSFYEIHTVNGSMDNIVSYNIEFMSGEGLLIEADRWTNVGRIGFDIADINGEVSLSYMDENMFPPTYVGEFYNELRMTATAGSFTTFDINLQEHCDATVGVVNPELENSVSLFPTLARDFINLRCDDNICGNLRIIDVQGRVIQHQQGQNTSSTNSFDISALPSGMYFLQTNINEYYLTRRFIKI